jgi:biopolymer transport protein ExbB
MLNLFERGGFLMWPLLLLSMVSLTVVAERLLFWIREGRQPARAALEGALRDLDLDRRDPGSVEVAIGYEQRRLERGLMIIDTTITAAPLLGILGTVLGIIQSFELLSATVAVDPLAISGGVAKALVTTAAGLVIALLALFPLNLLRTRVERRIEELEREATRLLATF